MQFGFVPESEGIHAVFILRGMQEEYQAKGRKFYMFCGPRESFLQSTKESVGIGYEVERNT